MPRFLLLALIVLMSSCSLIRTVSMNTISDVFYDAGFSLEEIDSWDDLQKSLPAVVVLNDSLLSVDPDNEGLLLTSLKGHAATGFAIHETLYLKDFINLNDESLHKENALRSYTKAFRAGVRYLANKDVQVEKLVMENIPKLLDKKLSQKHEDFEAVFFTAQSLAGILNLNKDKMTYISQLPIAKGMFDWVCQYRPNFNHGACDIFYGAYEAGRPKMLGGNPQKGKKIFLNLIEKNPANWLARVSYIQYYLIPMMDEDGYKKQKFHLENNMKILKQARIWNPEKKVELPGDKRLHVYQSIAMKRFETIKKYEKEIF